MDVLIKAHGGFAYLLELLAIFCFCIAVLTQFAGHKEKALKAAKIFTLGQSVMGGLLALSGLVLMFWGPWGYQKLWIWAGLALVIAYPVISVRVTKPALSAVIQGAPAGKWLAMTVVHVVLLLAVHALMVLKSV